MKQVNLVMFLAIFMVFTTTNNAAPAPKPHKNAITNKINGATDYTDDLPSPYAQLYLAADYYVQLKFRKSLSILTEVINQCPLAEDEPYNLFFVLTTLGKSIESDLDLNKLKICQTDNTGKVSVNDEVFNYITNMIMNNKVSVVDNTNQTELALLEPYYQHKTQQDWYPTFQAEVNNVVTRTIFDSNSGPSLFSAQLLKQISVQKQDGEMALSGFEESFNADIGLIDQIKIGGIQVSNSYVAMGIDFDAMVLGQDVFLNFSSLHFTPTKIILSGKNFKKSEEWVSTKLYYVNQLFVVMGKDQFGSYPIGIDTGFSGVASFTDHYYSTRYDIQNEFVFASDKVGIQRPESLVPNRLYQKAYSFDLAGIQFNDVSAWYNDKQSPEKIGMTLGISFLYHHFEEFRFDFENMEFQFKLREPTVN